jgi:glutamate-5-semialdehyde dehydrogenase
MQDVSQATVAMCRQARQASRALAMVPTPVKDEALRRAAALLRERAAEVLEANQTDVAAARKAGLGDALIDRLTVTGPRLEDIAAGLDEIADLPDPVGETIARWRRPNGLEISQVRVPIGVIGVIYESRPNVTADAAGLCLKSGNSVVLKGGSEALASNLAIAGIVGEAITAAGLPAGALQMIPTSDRQAVASMLTQREYIDVIVPRGGPSLIAAITESSRIPVIQHYAGICHIYVDADADLAMAEEIVVNAKTHRPATCNSVENLLVHESVAASFLSTAGPRLRSLGVELRGCPQTLHLLPGITAATEEDWSTEYLDLILAVKVVGSLDEAVDFINAHGTGLSDAIVTDSYSRSQQFVAAVDSAAVYVNASTRFTDGHQFGFGAEVGISTNRLHARGPMGLRELTTYKYVIQGSGQLRR